MMGTPSVKEYFVLQRVIYDWNLYDYNLLAECDTEEEAEEFIKEFKEGKPGMSNEYYILHVLGKQVQKI